MAALHVWADVNPSSNLATGALRPFKDRRGRRQGHRRGDGAAGILYHR